MSTRSGSKAKIVRPMPSVPAASTISDINLLDRLSILASILLSLDTSTAAAADERSQASEPEATTPDLMAGAGSGSLPPTDLARLPGSGTASGAQDAAREQAGADHRFTAQAGSDAVQPTPSPQADAGLRSLLAAHGSSTSPTLLKLDGVDDKAGSAALSLEKLALETLVVATPGSDVITSPTAATTFAFTGLAGPNNFDVFVGTGEGNGVDFSGLTGLQVPTQPPLQIPGTVAVNRDTTAPNGVLVDLTASGQTVATAAGPVTVQAWQLDADGKAAMPLAHLENIANVTGTVGNDIIIGNANANTFTYTAADGSLDGVSASYGFDVYNGGNGAGDPSDTVDFSQLGTRQSVADGLGADHTLLPHGAKGITVDLAMAVAIAAVDPLSGDTTTVTGSLVSSVGGDGDTDLALLAWTEDGGQAHATIENIVGSGGSDVILGDGAANTFVMAGHGENGASVFDGRAGNDTVDFSQLAPASGGAANAGGVVVSDGVYVNLTSSGHTADSSAGEATVQAWAIGADGSAAAALAHLEHVETVIGTVGSDVMVGDHAANTFVYTAADDATIDAAGQIAAGAGASYGFDIYNGGDGAGSPDGYDTADFSELGSQASVAAALAEGVDRALLPHGATGISVDLAAGVTVTTVDPNSGNLAAVTGSLVSTIGGSEATDLALLAWSAAADGEPGHATIENIVSSGGSDAIWGDDADNTVVITGNGENGPTFFDGRGGSDTVDFSQLGLAPGNSGVEIRLNQTSDNVADPTGGVQADVVQVSALPDSANDANGQVCDSDQGPPVAQLKDVENVVGSGGNDVIEGNSNDNVLSGGGGSDSFLFTDVAVVDGRGITQIGHDIIRDFRLGGIDDDDHLVFDPKIFNFHDGSSLDWLQQLLTNNQIRDDGEGLIIWIDDNNSITLQNYELDDHSGPGLGLGAYASWIVFV